MKMCVSLILQQEKNYEMQEENQRILKRGQELNAQMLEHVKQSDEKMLSLFEKVCIVSLCSMCYSSWVTFHLLIVGFWFAFYSSWRRCEKCPLLCFARRK